MVIVKDPLLGILLVKLKVALPPIDSLSILIEPLVVGGGGGVQLRVKAGLPVVVPQLLSSAQVLDWLLLVQALHAVHCQLGVQVLVQLLVNAGLPLVVPQFFVSVHVLDWVPLLQLPQSEHCQLGVHVEPAVTLNGHPSELPPVGGDPLTGLNTVTLNMP